MRLLLLLFPLILTAQQSPIEMQEAEISAMLGVPIHYMEPLYWKAPMDAALPELPPMPRGMACADFTGSMDSDHDFVCVWNGPEFGEKSTAPKSPTDGDSTCVTWDANTGAGGCYTGGVSGETWSLGGTANAIPSLRFIQATVTNPTVGSSGVTVSFASQGPAALKALTGKLVKGMQIVKANVCAPGTGIVSVGRILSMANKMGIADIDSGIANALVTQTVDRNWRHLLMVGAVEGTSIAASIFVPGIVAASKSVSTGLVIGHIFLDHAPALIAPGAPQPAPLLNSLADASANLAFNGPSCQKMLFVADYNGKGSRIVTGPMPLD